MHTFKNPEEQPCRGQSSQWIRPSIRDIHGTIHLAGVIAVTGGPLQDIGTLQNISFVMKGGVI
ncbi:MAG: hypothetical protein WCF61_13565 [Terriglobales bacterium]